ncbi:54S ribosomal protein L8, mitochondrial [Coemansia biformis]|uniref:54S ribosomal protein L8, mitochondrial n=1 Tax=Coemansia biformis TaxID=1286918 RepID=A0A9W8CWR6_9FUNG|nr:54S ribosomal protein L8, mitochondrial [Coemansia biformis]
MHGASSHRKLNMSSALRRQVLRNLTTQLVKHGRLETTLPRAKELRRLADKMITLGKRGTMHARHQIEAYLYEPKMVVPLLMETYAKRFESRPGGFTRIIPIASRKGDNAPMAMIEILNTDNPEAEVGFSYLVKSLATMQLREETKIVDKTLETPLDGGNAAARKQAKFARKVQKVLVNASMSPEKLQEAVDAEAAAAKNHYRTTSIEDPAQGPTDYSSRSGPRTRML